MELSEIVSIISNTGFPIALCVYILYLKEKRDDKHDVREQEFVEALNNNANALTELSTLMKEGRKNG